MLAIWGNTYQNQNTVVTKFIDENGLDRFIDELD